MKFRVLAAAVLAGMTLAPIVRAENTDADFKFMEYQAYLRNHPKDAQAAFAVGEYYFMRGNFAAAEEMFGRVSAGDENFRDVLTLAFLYRCSDELKDAERSSALENRLKEALSSEPFMALFRKDRRRAWTSPLNNRFEILETVDRLEITANGRPFCEIQLP